ncbi:unnamed protein product [Rotaria magnacalcarata]|uniref:Ras-GEF domain-containing protein n=1 Tax=Rotaria magnacalcarata TaxID=392030 RepID=A0A819R1L8_9BILA|nr:unnamed protein product [Rotaria magnacalcarata]CAF4037480.1 unnamed protein product [Rotaria magnacalcarata]
MHQRYGNNFSNSTMSSSNNGVFLGTAREKREKLLRKAYLNQQRNEASGGWKPHTPPPQTINESFPPEFRYFRHPHNSRTHSVDSISSSITNTNATNPINDHQMPRTASQTSLNMHRASPCPSDVSFSYSNPKYFVRTSVFRPSSALATKVPLHYENVIRSSLFDDKQHLGINNDESTFRSPTPGPDFSAAHSDSITLDELIDRLTPTSTSTPEITFLYPALLCCRTYINPILLFNKIAKSIFSNLTRCSSEQRTNLLLNYLSMLIHWTKTFSYDFRTLALMNQLECITSQIVKIDPGFGTNVKLLLSDIMSKLNILDRYEQYLQLIDNEIATRLTTSALTTDIYEQCPCPKEFAHQLTHIELDRLKAIGAEEFIHMRSSDSSSASDSRSTKSSSTTLNAWTYCLEAYVNWSNRLSSFVTTEIIKHLKRHIRVKLLNYFIDAALECFNTGNFNSMMGILGGLNMLPVKRLKKTWSKANRAKLDTLEKYMNPSKNFCIYRSIVKAAMQRAEKHNWQPGMVIIPFLSIFLRDVYFIKVRSPDLIMTNDQHEELNLKKFYILARFISEEFIRCKSSKCSFARYESIINYVVTSPVFSEDSLMAASFECEPPETEHDREQLRSLRAKLGF